MESFAKLVYQTYVTYLPTAFPAHYYGMPNGKIYLVFSRFYKVAFGKSGLEFVFAEHKDFCYDYENEMIVPVCRKQKNTQVFSEEVDYPRAKIDVFSISRKLQSYGEAYAYLNHEAGKMQQYA